MKDRFLRTCASARWARALGALTILFLLAERSGMPAGAGDSAKSAPAVDARPAAAAFDQLWEAFDRDYPKFILHPEVDWGDLRQQYRPQALRTRSGAELAAVCAQMLRPLRDLHVWLSVDNRPVAVFDPPRPANANPAAYQAILGDLHQETRAFCWAITSDNIGFIAIHTWHPGARIPAHFDEALERMRRTRGLIIDVRLNGGGGDPEAESVAGRFLEKEYVYAAFQYRTGPKHTDLCAKTSRAVQPRGPWRYDRPVVVLMGRQSLSANEWFISMMGGATNVTTMGERTGGSSGNFETLDLPRGLAVGLPRWVEYRPDGTPLEEHGIEPQVPFTPAPRTCPGASALLSQSLQGTGTAGSASDPGAFRGRRDDLLSAALQRLRQAPLPDASADASFAIGATNFLLHGQPFQIRCGEMHFARIPREYWAQRLRLAHAMGLNTVCAYLFWNLHEPQPGKFDFAGMADAAEFCRRAQAEGLKVILRPGPYSCAEWDFGGLPWWLLKTPGIKLRAQDPHYLAACKNYLSRVGRELAPLQITRGGPIIMVQVENEYGSYGHDREYLGLVRDDLKAAGFDVPLFTCDGPEQLKNDTRDDIFSVVNLGKDPEKNIQALRAIRPAGPLMVGEYYPGWFDSWGKPHHTGDTGRIVAELGWMLEHNVSFSIYMVHGGTSFGFDAGANSPPFSPQITSYDYDAPISEAGWTTPKFFALRELFSRHLNPGETIPDVPPRHPVITLAPVQLKACAPLFANLPQPASSERPEPMEKLDQAHGAILYRTELPAGAAGQLELTELHDYGLLFLNGKRLATLDRRLKQNTAELPPREKPVTLDILVDTFGHINYGHDMGDFKGIKKVELKTSAATNEITGWKMFVLPMDLRALAALKFRQRPADGPAFYRGVFRLQKTADTFLDLSRWGKGMVWVNGHNLGRFWNLGPQQTLYCPAPWLKTGRNEILVFESNGAKEPVVAGLSEPILNQLKDQGKP